MWSKKIVNWTENNIAYLSLPFTWQLPAAYSLAVWYREQGFTVRAGGPGVSLLPDYLSGVAKIGGDIDALVRHHPAATFTSRGCIRHCKFCAVPKIEGALVELKDWDPKPIICDNNLLACSQRHFNTVIDRIKGLKGVDFNQGLDARLLTSHHIERFKELDVDFLRLSWDSANMEVTVIDAINRLRAAGFPKHKIRVYVLINFGETPAEALYRCETLKALRIFPNVQRFNPLDTLSRDSYVSKYWTNSQLKIFVNYWSRQVWYSKIPFEEYHY